MKEFAVAAARTTGEEAEAEADEEYTREGDPRLRSFLIQGKEYWAKLPSTGQISVLMASRGFSSNLQAIHNLLRNALLDDGYPAIVELLNTDTISLGFLFGGDEQNEQGILDYLIEEAVGRPTTPPTDSSASPKNGGRRSTGRVNATPSRSRQTDSAI
jgi:hypothetical protein